MITRDTIAIEESEGRKTERNRRVRGAGWMWGEMIKESKSQERKKGEKDKRDHICTATTITPSPTMAVTIWTPRKPVTNLRQLSPEDLSVQY